MLRFFLHFPIGLITFVLGVGAMFIFLTASYRPPNEVVSFAERVQSPAAVKNSALEPKSQDFEAKVLGDRRFGSEIFTEYPPVTKGVFANLSYPAAPILGNSATGDTRKFFELKGGIFRPKFGSDGYIVRTGAYLKSVFLADVTGDGVKEAIATIGPIHPGTAVWYGIYIYGISNGRPTGLLWSFATGDRGVGGLNRVYGGNGDLVVELWGWNSGPDNPPTSHFEGYAGSSYSTRRIYAWNGRRFVQRGKARIFKRL